LTSLEYAISNVSGDPINKTQAWKQVRKVHKITISNRDFLKKVSDMLDMGYLTDVSKNKHEFLIQRVNETDNRNFLSVLSYQNNFLNESIEELSKHKKLFKLEHFKAKKSEYMLRRKVIPSFQKFNMAIDYLMIGHMRAIYMLHYGMIKQKQANDMIKEIEKVVKKGITKLYEDHPKDKKNIIFTVRKINRNFDNFLI